MPCWYVTPGATVPCMSQKAVAVLKASNASATVAWYRAAGFEVTREEPGLCEVARGGLVLQFLSGETPWSGAPVLSGCFYVHVSDVDAVASEVTGELSAPWGVEDRDWGARELVLRDPDGYFITFTAPRSGSATDEAAIKVRCWCCDGEFPESDVVQLGAHPEVSVCLDCARFMKRRAAAKRDEQRWTPLGAVRGGLERLRGTVIENGWHERGPSGALLRRLDRFLP